MSIRTRQLKGGRRAYDVELRRPDGTKYGRTFHTKREAETWEAQQRADRSRSRWVDPTAGHILFRDYADEWLRNRPKLRPRTVELYRSELRCHLLPVFGDIALDRITKRLIRGWYADLVATRSQVTAAKCYRLLAAILNTAVDDELIGSNACRIKGAAVERSPERPLATIDEVFAIANAIEPRYRALVLLAAFCGLRLGELTGLTRADLDPLHRTVAVTKQRQELATGTTLSAPKSAAAVRKVAIPPAIAEELELHLASWAEPGRDGALFTGPKGGLRRASFYKAWHEALQKARIRSDLRPHDLRHLANMLAARVPGTTTKDLMARIGHVSAQASLRYQHATEAGDRAMSVGIDAAIREARSGGAEGRTAVTARATEDPAPEHGGVRRRVARG
ncbi:MAG: site-specific integrase [Actinomycetota bacterium]|nr:site-specific integrase [Actinomycetota bacterium]